MSTTDAAGAAAPWYAAYPEPRNKQPGGMTKAEVLAMMEHGKVAGRDYVLVDLRRNDFEVSDERLTMWGVICSSAGWSPAAIAPFRFRAQSAFVIVEFDKCSLR